MMGDMHAARTALERINPRPAKPPTLIFAATLQRAASSARGRKLKHGEWRFVKRLSDIQPFEGRDSCVVVVADSWYGSASPKEGREILERLRSADLTHEFDGLN